jgi:pyruvate,orthophosphate dikinase
VRLATTLGDMDKLLDEIDEKRRLLRQVIRTRESNPMLGFRGCRLGLLFPEVTRMQCRAIFEAACQVQGEKEKGNARNHGAACFAERGSCAAARSDR